MTTIDLTKFPINHLDLHGETLISAIEIEVSAFEMEALIKSNPEKPETMNSSYIRSFYNSLSSKNPICLGVSDELKSKLKIDLIGKSLKFNQHAQPISIINKEDILDIVKNMIFKAKKYCLQNFKPTKLLDENFSWESFTQKELENFKKIVWDNVLNCEIKN